MNNKFIKSYCLLFTAISINISYSQVFQKAATDAFLVTRMAEKFHIQPKNLDKEFSSNVFTTLLKKMDNDKIFFTQEDIKQLEIFRYKIDDEIVGKKTSFIELFAKLYTQRLQQADTIITNISKQKFNYNLPEKYTVTEDTSFAVNSVSAAIKLYKNIKYASALSVSFLVKELNQKSINKQFVDSLEPVFKKKICDVFKRNIQKDLQYPGGVQQLICTEYCNAIATCYDPHTAFMTMTERENFESQVGKKNMVFGFNLQENEDGEVAINNLMPGSPAFKSGMLNKGDKITSIQWEGAKPIDVSNASIQEISQMLSTSNHSNATITFTKSDGTKRQVTLGKELATDDVEEDKVTSYLLKGNKNIGYISLPSFYEDWENENSINGCSNDVAKEILKLKKENIEGLILDLRYNGGGSVHEAVDLAGIFIDVGPIAQMKLKDPKPFTLKDLNRGTIYDGPLTVLINGFSASASELLAGVFQDYNRALIVGSTTFGKATGQRVLPIDTTINIKEYKDKEINGNAIKLTLSQVFQVSGKTAQFAGVIPDIILPDATEAYNRKERNEPFAIPAKNIEANKYYLPLKPLPIEMLKEKATEYEKADLHFNEVRKYIATKKISQQKVDVSLKLEDIIKLKNIDEDDENEMEEVKTDTTQNIIYTVNNNSFELQRINANENLKTINESFKNHLLKDSYVKMAYKLLLLMNK